MDLHDRFEAVSDDFLKFERVENRLTGRPDLHAFMLLDKLFPGSSSDIVCGAEHDEIFLDVSEVQAETLTDEQILELHRCGVRHDSTNGICMFA